MNNSPTYFGLRRYASRILVAEDNPVHRSLVRSLLEQMGCEVVAVTNGYEAVEQCSSKQFDLIFMDWRMPRLDGVAATKKIRAAEAGLPVDERIPIIALTAHALPGDRSRCLNAGMDDYLSKPVSRRNLDFILNKWEVPVAEAPEPLPEIEAEIEIEGPEADSVHVLDMAQIEELTAIERDGAPGLVRHLIDTYLSDAPAKLTLLKTAAADSDPLGVQVATHSFKAASSTVGAHRLYRMCNDLEQDARSRHLDRLEDRVRRILDEFDLVEQELGTLREQSRPEPELP